MLLPCALVGLVLAKACASTIDNVTSAYDETARYFKCCDLGLGLELRTSEHVESYEFKCVSPADNKSAIQESAFVMSTSSDHATTGFPRACNSSNLRVMDQTELEEMDELPVSHCIDKVLAGNLTASVVALVCDGQQDNEFTRIPDIVSVSKCCPLGLNYDEYRHVCTHGNVTRNAVENMFRDYDLFLDYSFGVPTCEEVLIDQFILPSDVVRDNGTIAVASLRLTPGKFCVEQVRGDEYAMVVRSCDTIRDSCPTRNCFRKCCPEGQSYERTVCRPGSEGVSKFPFQQRGHELGILHGLSCLRYPLNPALDPNDMFHIEPGGSLYAPLYHNDPHYALDRYCVEARGEHVIALLCFPEKEPLESVGTKPPDHVSYTLVNLGLIPSSILLFATLIVYLLLPSLQNLHGKTLMCHVASMCSAYVCLVTSIFFPPEQSDDICTNVGYVMLFSFLASFFWLNIMCLDIWWTFRSLRSIHHGSRQKRECRRFALYSIYAWGLPITLTVICVVMDKVAGLSPWSIKPEMGIGRCWFSRKSNGVMLYFYGPVSLLLFFNIVLFVVTARNCSKVKAEIYKMRSDRLKSSYRADKIKFVMNVKLFVVMGISWTLEFVSDMVNLPYQVWYISDAANSLQGVLIFCIFVMKRKVLRELKQRFRTLFGRGTTRPNSHAMMCYDPYAGRKSTSTSTLCTTVLSHSSENDKRQRV